MTSDQELFWRGDFVNEYIARNQGGDRIASNTSFFSRIFKSTKRIESLLEMGPNIGMNLHAIKRLLPKCNVSVVEINPSAVDVLRKNFDDIEIYQQSILEFNRDQQWDFVFTKGVLIHINPQQLTDVYQVLDRCCRKYLCMAEYYSPIPQAIPYHGYQDRLFKRDFAGEFLDTYPDYQLLDYGFSYHRDTHFPQDDINWFLMEKCGEG